jgi:glucose-6-phosphate-specific signal transduction histidine kinase
MTMRSGTLLLWSPRVLGILVCLFLSLFALDAFSGGKSVDRAVTDFLIHVAPMLALLGVVALSWRWEWVGGIVFTALALTYAYVARQHLSWIPVVSGPLLAVGVLFLWSWTQHRRLHGAA